MTAHAWHPRRVSLRIHKVSQCRRRGHIRDRVHTVLCTREYWIDPLSLADILLSRVRYNVNCQPSFSHSQIGAVAVRALRVAWYCIRMPLAAILALLEPVVRAVLTLGAVLCILAALFFEFVSRLPTHSLLALLGAGFACAVILALYQHVLLLVNR